MHDHLNISKEVYDKMRLSVAQVIKLLPLFGPSDEIPKHKGEHVRRPFSYINLLHYIDNCGPSFMIAQIQPRHKIAKALFDACDAQRKLIIYSYIEWYEEQLEK